MLSIKNLSFSFKKQSKLLSGLDLEAEAGNIYGLFGLNGAGKTTLFHNITGALFPDAGSCLLNGMDPGTRSPQVLKDLYMVPEQFFLPDFSGEQYIRFNAGFYPDFSLDLIREIMSEFDLDPNTKLTSLSFGQQKKFMIAFAIATRTKLLLLDEPTSGLDIPSKSQFRRILASLDNESRCIIISTHQVRDLGSMIDHVLVLNDGKIVFDKSLNLIMGELDFQLLDHHSSVEYLYGEKSLGGIQAIVPNQSKNDSQIDLELLFNGIIENSHAINEPFMEKG